MGLHEPEDVFMKRKAASLLELKRVWRNFGITKDAWIIQGRSHSTVPEFDMRQKLVRSMPILEKMTFLESRELEYVEDVIELLEVYLDWFAESVIPNVIDERGKNHFFLFGSIPIG